MVGDISNIDNQINQDEIIIPPRKFEAPRVISERAQIQQFFDSFLNIPKRVDPNQTNDLPKRMASFLADKRFISGVKTWNRSWGYGYDSNDKTISIAEYQMPPQMYEKYVIQLGKDRNTGQSIYPKPEDMDQYRFLHEVSHAWQDYEVSQEGSDRWFDKAIAGENDSPYAVLFRYCYQSRHENDKRGITTWGGQTDYDAVQNRESRSAIRAIDDVNELVTMYLWHPDYFAAHMDYLAQDIPGLTERHLEHDGLTPIDHESKQIITDMVTLYVQDMRRKAVPDTWQ